MAIGNRQLPACICEVQGFVFPFQPVSQVNVLRTDALTGAEACSVCPTLHTISEPQRYLISPSTNQRMRVKPLSRLELETSPLPRECSTAELQGRVEGGPGWI